MNPFPQKKGGPGSRKKSPVRIGVIGVGHWGSNHVRVFGSLPGSQVVCAADPDSSRHSALKKLYPAVEFYADYRKLLDDKKLDAVVVSTPSSSHYKIVCEALSAGLDVLCEKPLALTVRECEDLVRRSETGKRVLKVGHIMLYNPALQKLKNYFDKGEFGKVYYIMSVRTNLGPVRPDVDVIYDLATHDISMCNYLLGKEPVAASGANASYLGNFNADVSFINLRYPGNVHASFHVSWLTPPKRREVMIVGERQVITWDDLNPNEPVRVYSIGKFEEPYYYSFGEFQRMSRDSEITLPVVGSEEPLIVQNRHFLECVRTRQTPLANARFATTVIRAVELIQANIRKK